MLRNKELWKRVDAILKIPFIQKEIIIGGREKTPFVLCNCTEEHIQYLDSIFNPQIDKEVEVIFPSCFNPEKDSIIGYGSIDMIDDSFATGIIDSTPIKVKTEKRTITLNTFKCYCIKPVDPKSRKDNTEAYHYSATSSLRCAIERLGRPENILIFVRNGKK